MNQQSIASVAIIVVNFNCYSDTSRCLDSLLKLNYPNYSVYCIDNASSDNSFVELKKEFEGSEIRFIASTTNTGFAGGCNIGIKDAIAEGLDFAWLVNADATVEKDSLLHLVAVVDEFPRVAAAGSKILFPPSDERDKIWSAGGEIDFENFQISMPGYDEKDSGQHNKLKVCDYLPGCSLLMRTDAVRKIGYLPEGYFMYFEETDWCVNASRNYGPLLYVPKSIVWHHFDKEKTETPFTVYYYNRNSLKFWFKYSLSLRAKLKVVITAIKKGLSATYAYRKAPNDDVKAVFASHVRANLHFLLFRSGK